MIAWALPLAACGVAGNIVCCNEVHVGTTAEEASVLHLLLQGTCNIFDVTGHLN